MLPSLTGEFRVVEDPTLKFAASGIAVGSIRLVANSRKKVNDEWVDDKVLWIKGTAFKQQAENMAESLSKGDLAIVTGRLVTEEWEKDGEKRQATALLIDHIGPSIAYKVARPETTERKAAAPAVTETAAAPASDPWAATAQGDEPPF